MENIGNTSTESARLLDVMSEAYDILSSLKLDGIFKRESRALHFISSSGQNGISPSELSRKLRVSRARVTVILAALRKKNFISLSISTHDKRRSLARITERGYEYYSEMYDRFCERVSLAAKDMGESGIEELSRLLNSFTSVLAKLG